MSQIVFQTKFVLDNAVDLGVDNQWQLYATIQDSTSQFTAASVAVGDVIFIDSSAYEPGTLSQYVVSTIDDISADPVCILTVTYAAINNNTGGMPDLSYCVGSFGVISRPTPNLGLIPSVAPDAQQIPDFLSVQIQNFNLTQILDSISGGGTPAVKPDWNAATGTAAEILNKPVLGTSAALNAPITGDAAANEVVIGSDTRLVQQPITITNATPTPTAIGGIAAGTVFASVPIETVLQSLLYPFQVPAFTAFTLSGQTSPIEVGSSVAAGARTFTWTTSNSANIKPNLITIADTTGGLQLVSNTGNDGTETISISAVTKLTATSHTWNIQSQDTQNTVFSRNYTVNWQWRRYFGESVSSTLNEAAVKALRVSGLITGFAGTYAFNAGGYKYIAYPALFGTATAFKDQSTNLDVPFDSVQIVGITNTYGVATNYNVHKTTNIIGSAMNIVVS